MHLRFLAVLLVLSLGVVACGGGQPAPAPATEPAAAPAPAVDPASAATVAGKINLEGTPPANAPIRMNADPACVAATKGQNPTQETFVSEAGGLGNVFVYVQSGLTGTFHELGKSARRERRSAFAGEHKRRLRLLLALQFP